MKEWKKQQRVLCHKLFVLRTEGDCFHSAHMCSHSARAHCTPVSPPGGSWVTSLCPPASARPWKILYWRNRSISSQAILALEAVYCNSMGLFMKGNSFLIGKLCCCTSVRNKDMQWVNKHIRVNPNKQKWRSLAAWSIFISIPCVSKYQLHKTKEMDINTR